MDENTSLWNKPVNELTLKDQMVASAVVSAVIVGGYAVVAAGAVAYNKVADKIRARKAQKNEIEK